MDTKTVLSKSVEMLLITIISASIALVILITLTFYGMFLKSAGSAYGSLTDWIISVANLVMAFAAIYAAWIARGWFNQKSHSIGHDQAIKLINDIETLHMEFWDLFHVRNDIKFKKSQFGTLVNPVKDDDILQFTELQSTIFQAYMKASKALSDVDDIERWGIKIRDRDTLIKTISYYINYYIELQNMVTELISGIQSLKYEDISSFKQNSENIDASYESLSKMRLYPYTHFKTKKFSELFSVI